MAALDPAHPASPVPDPTGPPAGRPRDAARARRAHFWASAARLVRAAEQAHRPEPRSTPGGEAGRGSAWRRVARTWSRAR
jgi:hypothetical protein